MKFALLFVPGLLTEKLNSLTAGQAHWIANRLRITEGLHDWLHGMCPCQVEFEMEDWDDAAA